MDRNTFYQQMQKQAKKYLPEVYKSTKMEIREIETEHGKRQMLVMFPEGGEFIPALDIDVYFRKANEGEPLGKVAKMLTADYLTLMGECVETMTLDPEAFTDQFHIGAVNYEKYKVFLENIPIERIEDLAIVPMVRLPNGQSVLLTSENAAQLDVTGKELFELAKENHKQILPADLIYFPEQQERRPIFCNLKRPFQGSRTGMFRLTSMQGDFSAAYITDEMLLKDIGSYLQSSYYILPVSMHDLFIVPAGKRDCADPNQLKYLTERINQVQTLQVHFLSNNIYRYDKEEKQLSMFDGKPHPEKQYASRKKGGKND